MKPQEIEHLIIMSIGQLEIKCRRDYNELEKNIEIKTDRGYTR